MTRQYEIKDFAIKDDEKALKTVFYSTDATSGSVWVIQPGQTLAKHTHNNADDIWIIIQGEGVFYPSVEEEVPFHTGQVIVNKKGECHGAKNTGNEDVIFISVVGPVPADYNPL